VFSGSVIRKLARSEEVFAEYQVFTAITVQLRGLVDVDVMSEAFDAVLQANPVFDSHLEQGSDGSYHIVADDLLHSGIWVVDSNNGMPSEHLEVKLDQSASLINLRVTLREEGAELTLYVHHSIADGHHLAALLDDLSTRYTNLVSTGDPGPITPRPAPLPMEVVLEQRGIKKLGLSGAERMVPLMYAYDLPPEKPTLVTSPGPPQAIPVSRCRLTKQETADIVAFSRDHGLSLNTVVAAAILLTEWQLRETPHVPIPYFYAVDLRYFVSPPVSATDTTNLVGIGGYLAEIGPDTDVVDLASDITATFRADLANGLIQQSVLHIGTALDAIPPGLPPMVFCTDVSALPSPTLVGTELRDFQSQFYCSSPIRRELNGGFYGCGVHAGRLQIQQNTQLPVPAEKTLEAIRSMLCSLPSEYGWVME
jgi:phenolphthiocerol/phthiocerol/phthiodiolone dimycocerosyl transferase